MNITIETLQTDCGFFQTYATNKEQHFQSLFGELTTSEIEALDNLLTDVQGNRELLTRYARMYSLTGAQTLQNRLVETIDLLMYENWLSVKATIEKALQTDVDTPLKETREIETTRQGGNTHNVFTVDATTPVKDGQTVSNEGVNTSETVYKSNGKLAVENARKVIDFFKMSDYLAIVLHDIAENISYSVY